MLHATLQCPILIAASGRDLPGCIGVPFDLQFAVRVLS